jgi:hypothetical protein
LILEFINACVAKVENGGRPSVSTSSLLATVNADSTIQLGKA